MRSFNSVLVTGGSGFIGSACVRYLLNHPEFKGQVVNLDLLTYAADPKSLDSVKGNRRYTFVQGNISDRELVTKICAEHAIDVILHFAAETHVDRSIGAPHLFFETNLFGTLSLLEVVRKMPKIHFHHISTDEVYGSLGLNDSPFTEKSPYSPNSPYSASKAASDHAVRAYAHTYSLSTTISHCTNNYGPFQHTEKLIPQMLLRCLKSEPLPVYGDGKNVRDWLFVDDHVEAIWAIAQRGATGEVYDVGGDCERSNLETIDAIIRVVASLLGTKEESYRQLVTFVPDRPGHDFRYAIDTSKIKEIVGWRPGHSYEAGLRETVEHYLACSYAPQA
jgi:dTDP-glucose 4,6-dehydratase